MAEKAFITWGTDKTSRETAMVALSNAVPEFRGISRADDTSRGISKAAFYQDLSDLTTNISGRPGLSRGDYDKFRPGEKIPAHRFVDIIRAADTAYNRVGLVRNTVDLMGDFACQGIRIVHPNKRIEKFYQNWFKRVCGPERSERFLNNLYRTANVIVRRQTAKISTKVEKELYKAQGKADIKALVKVDDVSKKEIPWKYTFINPCIVTNAGGPLSSFVNEQLYTITLPADISMLIKAPKTPEEKRIVDQLPDDIKRAAKTNQPYLIPPDKVAVYHYKKDDWLPWAYPMIYAILDDIGIIEKLKLADLAALDGAISNIRIFKLGNLQERIAPTRVAAAKLAEILENNVGGGTMDIIWGPDIDLLETSSNVYQFLGEEKYKPHLNSVYVGLGIPPTLTGTFGTAGTTNNYISLKTLVQRLRYGREVLVEFWNKEIAIVQKAMGFKLPASIEFDIANLGDEVAEKALLIQMADRQLISDELLQVRYGSDPVMEKVRMAREERERNKGQRPAKAGPYHDAQWGVALKKIALQTGQVTPGEVGLQVDENREHLKRSKKLSGEKLLSTIKMTTNTDTKKSGIPQQGRPKNSKDTTKRKEKAFKPKAKAELLIWTKEAQAYIADVVSPFILNKYGKNNLRKLSNAEAETMEELKFSVLFDMEPFTELNQQNVLGVLDKGCGNNELKKIYKDYINAARASVGRELTLDEIHTLQVNFYLDINEGDDDGNS